MQPWRQTRYAASRGHAEAVKLSDFDFPLPEHLIAQHPLPGRDQSRMMVVNRRAGTWQHRIFRELTEILGPEHFLVMNNTRVFPARLHASRPGKTEDIEILLVRETGPREWIALLKPGRKGPEGQRLQAGDLQAEVVSVRDDGTRVLRFLSSGDFMAALERQGAQPLPPYIRRPKGDACTEDRDRYQTIYAKTPGSVAAPTAGLHFTKEVLRRLDDKGISRCEILLHVGYGTFQPVRSVDIETHRMDPEYFEVSDRAAAEIRSRLDRGQQLIAVGTTTTRVLESLARQPDFPSSGASGYCELFIYPGFRFRAISGLLTNFHLPQSTLFMLVSALAGRDLMLKCYSDAVRNGYRFFSYGDCMLIL
jgi:S-adenosylmethionine:tRNA ribosyltransferase-isomerase